MVVSCELSMAPSLTCLLHLETLPPVSYYVIYCVNDGDGDDGGDQNIERVCSTLACMVHVCLNGQVQ